MSKNTYAVNRLKWDITVNININKWDTEYISNRKTNYYILWLNPHTRLLLDREHSNSRVINNEGVCRRLGEKWPWSNKSINVLSKSTWGEPKPNENNNINNDNNNNNNDNIINNNDTNSDNGNRTGNK